LNPQFQNFEIIEEAKEEMAVSDLFTNTIIKQSANKPSVNVFDMFDVCLDSFKPKEP
jgi:hypothetical protein